MICKGGVAVSTVTGFRWMSLMIPSEVFDVADILVVDGVGEAESSADGAWFEGGGFGEEGEDGLANTHGASPNHFSMSVNPSSTHSLWASSNSSLVI
jgi:hypothetical protein